MKKKMKNKIIILNKNPIKETVNEAMINSEDSVNMCMNNGIKEILDFLKEPQNGKICKVIFEKDSKLLLDYITNLQEENDILKRDIEAMKHNYNLLVRFIENGESMTQKFENGLTYQDYKSRCEKAIEYIHNNQPVFELSSKEQIQEWFEKEYYVELLHTLQGSDKE